MTDALDLPAMKALEAAASAPPWLVSAVLTTDHRSMVCGGKGPDFGLVAEVTEPADAAFIAAAREAVPALLAKAEEAEALRAENARLREALALAREGLVTFDGDVVHKARVAVRAALAPQEPSDPDRLREDRDERRRLEKESPDVDR